MVKQEMESARVVVQGPPGSGKTTFLLRKYEELVSKGITSQQILVLVANRSQKAWWENNLQLAVMGPQIITSYFGFIQRELRQYWPLVQSQLENWGRPRIEPFFLTIESSQYLMGQIVEDLRNQGSMLEVVSTSDRIAIELIQNLSRGVMGGTHYQEIGQRLYNSQEHKEQLNANIYRDLQKALNKFRQVCLERGILDYSLATEIYHNTLFQQSSYRRDLAGRIRYLLVDNLEESVIVQLDLVQFFLTEATGVWLAYCPEGGYSCFAGAVPHLAAELLSSCEIFNLNSVHTASRENTSLGDTLAANILTKERRQLLHQNYSLLETELRSTLIQKVGQKIVESIEAGIAPNQIVVIAPYIDSVLEIALNYYLLKSGHEAANLTRKSRVIDQPYIQALITLACLAHPQWELLPKTNDIADTISLVVGLDPVRSGILAEETAKKRPYCLPDLDQERLRQRLGFAAGERYEFLKRWLTSYQSQPSLPINTFLQSVFTQLLSSLPQAEEHLLSCRQLIDSAGQFLELSKALEGEQEAHSRQYIQFLKRGIKGAENLLQIQHKLQPTQVILASPYVYLASSLSSHVQVWMDLSSEHWYKSDVQELANVHVLKRDWPLAGVWVSQLDERYRREKAAIIMRALIKKCRRHLVLADSLYCSQGYEQEGWISQVLRETLVRGESDD